MLFSINQYRVLKSIVNFSYKATHTESDFSPYIKEMKPFGLPIESIHKHCCFLHRQGLIEMNYDKSQKQHMVSVTEKGIDYYFSQVRTISSTAFVCFWNVVMLALGVIIGKVL
jgi:hypothetical protein